MSATKKPSKRADVLFYVQHLLGIGHLRRASVLARAMDRAGLRVVFVSGGMPVPGTDVGGCAFVQLPPLRTLDESFSALVDAEGRELDDAGKTARRDLLLGLLEQHEPRVILFEMFPFGRRQMRFELMPLLDAAKASAHPPQVFCSLRDILTTHKKPGKTEWIVSAVERYFDQVLVHGDPSFVTLEQSFPATETFGDKIRYTGYVVETAHLPTQAEPRRDGEVLVSAGGGAVAAPLIEAAIEARPLTSLRDVPWRLLAGHNLPEDRFRALQALCGEGIVLERARADFTELMARARLSISQAGYNTVMDILATEVPAVLVPFAATQQTEQTLRAKLLAERGAAVLLPEERLDAQTLARSVEEALAPARPTHPFDKLDITGAERTAALISDVAQGDREDAAP
ncbi:glycosyltransferase family protein [Denitrobaculum tricleocarpae]|uniref:Glycosyl transferase n=1 Tax=Denitrobaculum tricleocarpae TaxID=2591009 RepID=A0A545TRG1_9PROT|nr:glycosyltransferase [Denitrobaculum tricleocarpae]TQV79799.1 glycosyl transferase [Denitrobaculum tricleocarpae]